MPGRLLLVPASEIVERKFSWDEVGKKDWVTAWFRFGLPKRLTKEFTLLAGFRRGSMVWVADGQIVKATLKKPEWIGYMKAYPEIKIDVQNWGPVIGPTDVATGRSDG
jgi:hypothetical protein